MVVFGPNDVEWARSVAHASGLAADVVSERFTGEKLFVLRCVREAR